MFFRSRTGSRTSPSAPWGPPEKRCRRMGVPSAGTPRNSHRSALFGDQEGVLAGVLFPDEIVLGNHGMNALRVVHELGHMEIDRLRTEGISFQLGDAVILVQELDRLLHGHLAGLVQIGMESHH